jgi:hypothetical protein
MRTYKNHSPLFLYGFDEKGGRFDFSEAHFWVSTKSFIITSLEIDCEIKGKTSLLNYIFNINI